MCLATGGNGESDGHSHISHWQGDPGKGYIESGGGNRERKLHLFKDSVKRHEASWVSQGRQANIPRENGRGMLITEWEFQKSGCIKGKRGRLRKLILIWKLYT